MKPLLLNRCTITDFVDWALTSEWEASMFFSQMHRWFTGTFPKQGELPMFLASGYLISEVHAKSCDISDSAREYWNQLILTISEYHHSYRLTDRSAALDLLGRIKSELAKEIPGQIYTLASTFSPYCETFIERNDILTDIHTWLSSRHLPVFLYGIAGIGKSTLAKVYATKYAQFYDTILFASYETNLLDLIVDDQAFPIQGLTWNPRGKRGEKGRFFRKKIEMLKDLVSSRTLIIIDNFDAIKDSHLSDLLALPCKLLFTTRTSPQVFGMQGIPVREFSEPGELRNLFFLYAPDLQIPKSSLPALDRLLAAVHGHTLTIKLLASHLARTQTAPETFSIASSDIMEQIGQLVCFADLSRDERTVLRYMSLMPLTGISISRFAEYCRFTKMTVIHQLIQRNLIEYDSEQDRLSLHPMIAQMIRKLDPPTFQNCWSYASTICTFGRKTWWNTSAEMDQYRKYFYTFMEYITQPEKRRMDDIIYLVDGCWQLGNFRLAESYGLMLHDFCLEHFGPDHLFTARIRHSIGTIYYNWGKTAKASEWYRLGYSGYQHAPNPDVYFYGILLMKSGRALRHEKKSKEGEEFLQRAIAFLHTHLEMYTDLPADKPPKEDWLILLFDIYSEYVLLLVEYGRADAALEWCRKYLQQYDHYQFCHESMLWKPYYGMGLAQSRLSRFDEAQHSLNLAMHCAENYHQQNIAIHLMILEAMAPLEHDPNRKKEIQRKIRKLKR